MDSVDVLVLVQDSCLVVPQIIPQQQQLKRFTLSALAHMMWFVPYRTRVLFFKPASLTSFRATIASLKNSLSKTLVDFYPVAGRVSVREDGVIELNCTNEGVLLIEAVADVELELFETEYGNFVFPEDLLADLTQTCGYSLEWPWHADAPLLIVQATRFSCGGLSLSLMFNHQVLDGTAIWNFVKSWAQVCRGEEVSIKPDFNIDLPVNLPLQPELLDHLPSDLIRYERSAVLPGGELYDSIDCLQCEAFIFTKKMVGKLKMDSPGFTTFHLLTEHLWKKITSARKLRDEESTRVVFAINCRERLKSTPANYCGQGAMLIGGALSAGELLAEGLNNGAALLKKRIGEFTSEAATLYTQLLGTYGTDPEFAVGCKRSPSRDIIVKGSFYFPVYQDFGFGQASGMCVNPVLEDGKIYYFPAREQGDVIAYITLHVDAMKRLKADKTLLSAN